MTAPTSTEMRDKYLTAEMALLEGKEVRFGTRMLKMEDLNMIRDGRKEWERRVAAESAITNRAPTIGGLEMKVVNFNPAPHLSNDRFGRNY